MGKRGDHGSVSLLAMADEIELARLLTQIILSVERTGELLAQAADLHRQVADLHGEITGAAVGLDEMLKRARLDPAARV
jgi:hypothetical protein